MFKILKLSSTGFKLEGEDGSHWFTVDSLKILKSKTFKPPFESLKEGMFVDNLKFKEGKDKKMYIINFDVISQSHPDICLKKEADNTLKSSSADTKHSGFMTQLERRSPHDVDNEDVSGRDTSVPVSSGRQVLERERVNPPTVLNSDSAVAHSVQDRIMYGQCVNIAFNSLKEDLRFDGMIEVGFDLADKIYEQYNKRCLK